MLISKNLRVCVKEWRCENERLMKVRLNMENSRLIVIQI